MKYLIFIFLFFILSINSCQEFVPRPIVNFDASLNLAEKNQKISFTDLTTHSPDKWIWDFGDGNTSEEQNPSHQYQELGLYSVKLTAINEGGYDIETKEDYIEVVNETLQDFDFNVYKTVVIGTQTWMAENLNTTTLSNGEPILKVENDSLWFNISSPAYCWYKNDSLNNRELYGTMYNYYTIETEKLCPTGWHVPSDEEWKQLELFLGVSDTVIHDTLLRGVDQGSKLKSTGGWRSNGNGSNSSGFNAFPGGGRYTKYMDFYGKYDNSPFWTGSSFSDSTAWYRELLDKQNGVYRNHINKKDGYYVRCVKD